MNARTAVSIGFVLIVAPSAAFAQEVPYELRGCGTAESTVIDRAGDMSITQSVSRGVADSIPPGGPFDKMMFECRSLAHALKEGVEFASRCVFVDADGHKYLGMSVGTPKGWQWKFLGGTGKWEGITGGGPTAPDSAYGRLSPAVAGSCWKAKGTYSLKK